jgi:hypothetical protein
MDLQETIMVLGIVVLLAALAYGSTRASRRGSDQAPPMQRPNAISIQRTQAI